MTEKYKLKLSEQEIGKRVRAIIGVPEAEKKICQKKNVWRNNGRKFAKFDVKQSIESRSTRN